MPGKKGDARLARLRTLIGRAQERCGERAAELRMAYARVLEVARLLEPETGSTPTATVVRERVEAVLCEMTTDIAEQRVPAWLQSPLAHVVTVLLRLGDGLYFCYDVPGLPRTNNDLEHFYRRVKASERRITGHRRSDRFVVRVGGFAVYAIAAADVSVAELQQRLASVVAADWQRERARLHANQERQVKMRRFHLHRAAYLADLESRWTQLCQPP